MLSCLSGGMVNMVVIHVKRIIVCIMSPSLHGKLDFGAMRRAKRVYKTIPLDQKQTGNRGSATLEAMLVLPLFLMAAFACFQIGNLLQTRMLVYEAMQETAQYMAETKYMELTDSEADAGLDAVTAGMVLHTYIDDADMVDRYVTGGSSGIRISQADYDTTDGCIYLRLGYGLQQEIPFIGMIRWKVSEQICQKAYVGLILDRADNDDSYVYVAETGDVCHTSRNCYHIRLTIRQTELDQIQDSLSPCELCAEGKKGDSTVYVTETGNRFHYSIGCSGLKRTVTRVRKSDVAGLPYCSECGR